MGAFNRYFESNQCEKILNISKIHLKVNDCEFSNIIDEFLKYTNIKRYGFILEFENFEKDYRKKGIR